MPIPTEPIGSIPRPLRLLDALDRVDGADPSLDPLTAFAKIRARVEGTALAAQVLGIRV